MTRDHISPKLWASCGWVTDLGVSGEGFIPTNW